MIQLLPNSSTFLFLSHNELFGLIKSDVCSLTSMEPLHMLFPLPEILFPHFLYLLNSSFFSYFFFSYCRSVPAQLLVFLQFPSEKSLPAEMSGALSAGSHSTLLFSSQEQIIILDLLHNTHAYMG